MTQQDLFGDVPAPAPAPRPRQSGSSTAVAAQHTWFFALRPSPEDAARINALGQGLLASHGITGKRIGPERLHISLVTVGSDIGADMVDAACRAADTVHFPAITAHFDSAMTFSAPQGPFVLVGAKGTDGLDGVRGLRTMLACAMADQGIKPSRTFEPHMTLCYDARNRAAPTLIDPIEFRVAEFALIKSYIGQTRHEVLRTWALSG